MLTNVEWKMSCSKLRSMLVNMLKRRSIYLHLKARNTYVVKTSQSWIGHTLFVPGAHARPLVFHGDSIGPQHTGSPESGERKYSCGRQPMSHFPCKDTRVYPLLQ